MNNKKINLCCLKPLRFRGYSLKPVWNDLKSHGKFLTLILFKKCFLNSLMKYIKLSNTTTSSTRKVNTLPISFKMYCILSPHWKVYITQIKKSYRFAQVLIKILWLSDYNGVKLSEFGSAHENVLCIFEEVYISKNYET